MRRGLIIHQSLPACWVKATRTTQDTVNQEDTQSHPQRAQANHRTATPPTPKAQTHIETNPTSQKPDKRMDEHQKLICHTHDRRKPIPAHTNTRSTGSAATPRANLATPVPTPNVPKGITKSARYKHPQTSTLARRPE